MTDAVLWYSRPAAEWTDALPLGNGRLGAMIFGGYARDEIQLNEDTLWSGGPYDPANHSAADHLDAVRSLLFAGRYKCAQDLANKHSLGRPYLQTSFQPAGRLLIDFDNPVLYTDYRRELDLRTAIATTSYERSGVRFRREYFVSAADGILVIHLSADCAAAVSFSVDFVSEQPGCLSCSEAGLAFDGRNRAENGIEGQLRWSLRAQIRVSGGSTTEKQGRLEVRNADCAILIVDIATSYRRFDDVSGDPTAAIAARMSAVSSKSLDELRADHVTEHRALFDRLDIRLGGGSSPDIATGQRIAEFGNGGDPGLAALYVQYGRYLAIVSSRPGTQPTNLQGIWNKELRPPWGSKYTTNINLQMNYWLADPANIAECFEPLIALVEDLSETGRETARIHYRANGWVLHHNTDIWRATAPVDGAQYGLWPTGGAWLCVQLWDHAAYAGFPEGLVERIYPLLIGACRFFLDTLVSMPGTNYLVTAPSLSPEHVHHLGGTLCVGPAMDRQILRDLFDASIAAAGLLHRDEPLISEIIVARARLPNDRIGQNGQLQEWLEDWDGLAPDPHHRHVSHLYGAYPSLQISTVRTPVLAAAARRSLDLRGSDATGWGIAWRIALWARLGDAENAYDALTRLLSPGRSYNNLFDAHPPFQIDGNFGGAAGILEMLVQSDGIIITLLPTLPLEWSEGKLHGVRTRGGVVLDFAWFDRHLTELVADAPRGFEGSVICQGVVIAVGLPLGRTRLVG